MKSPTCSQLMKRCKFVMRLDLEPVKLIKVIAEIRFTLTLSKSAERTCILFWHSPQSEINSGTDAGSSQVSSTAVLSIGTIHGQLRPFTLLPTVSMLPMRLNLVLPSSLTPSARHPLRFTPQLSVPLKDSSPSSEEETTQLLLPISISSRPTRKCSLIKEELYLPRFKDIKAVSRDSTKPMKW